MHEQRTAEPNPIIIAADLGQARDYTAISVIERVAPDRFECGYLHRFRPRRYQEVVTVLARMVTHERRTVQITTDEPYPKTYITRAPVVLAVDYTGCGRPVCDLIEEARLDCEKRYITIHGGNTVAHAGSYWNIPKRDLMSRLNVLLENEQLIIAEGLPLTATFLAEMKSIRIKLSASGHDSYAAGEDWRSEKHDDLVLSLAMGAYFAVENDRAGTFEEVPEDIAFEFARWGIG
jgi:hypothetical protein